MIDHHGKDNSNGNQNNDNLREFACHTTVILAQPRVSRLRAAAIYVHSSGMLGQRWAWLGIRGNPGFSNANIFRRPPKIAPNLLSRYTEKCGKSAKKWGIGRRDLASQIAVLLYTEIIPYRDLGSTVVSVNLPKSGRSILQKSCFFGFFPKIRTFYNFLLIFDVFFIAKGQEVDKASPGR